MRSSLRDLFAGKPKKAVLGFACKIKNETLDLDLYGSPVEVRADAARESNLAFADITQHIDTEIKLVRISQDAPQLQWKGGPHAERILEVLEHIARGGIREVVGLVEGSFQEVGHIALIAAAERSQLGMVRALLNAGAIPHGIDSLGMTALHWAAARGHGKIAATLVEAGADTATTNWFCLSPADIAAINDHDSLVLRLDSHWLAPNWTKLTFDRMCAL